MAPAMACAITFALTCTAVQADPMRPLLAPVAAAASAAAAGAGAPPRAASPRTEAAAAAAPGAPALLAIRQDSAGRWQALFGERWLGLGDRMDGLTLSAIDSNTVRFGQGAGARTWNLLPALQAAVPDAAAPGSGYRPAPTRALDKRTP